MALPPLTQRDCRWDLIRECAAYSIKISGIQLERTHRGASLTIGAYDVEETPANMACTRQRHLLTLLLRA